MPLKMTTAHYDQLKAAIDAVLAAKPDLVSRYERGFFQRADKVTDLQMRFCFDLLYMAVSPNSDLIKEMYEYINDQHIYSALKQMCPKVTPMPGHPMLARQKNAVPDLDCGLGL